MAGIRQAIRLLVPRDVLLNAIGVVKVSANEFGSGQPEFRTPENLAGLLGIVLHMAKTRLLRINDRPPVIAGPNNRVGVASFDCVFVNFLCALVHTIALP